MKKKTSLIAASILGAAAGLALPVMAAMQKVPSPAAATGGAATERVDRGRYLVTIAACHDCHSPKIDAAMTPDPDRLLSGRPLRTFPPLQGVNEIRASLDLTAWAGPWGNSYAANLTPDRETGIGARYTEASFITTIRTGKKPEGEPLAPPMPWTVYRQMSDEDLKAVFAYLMSLPPVRNAVRTAPPATATKRHQSQ